MIGVSLRKVIMLINIIPKTGHYTYNYLKTLEIVFNMGEWQIW